MQRKYFLLFGTFAIIGLVFFLFFLKIKSPETTQTTTTLQEQTQKNISQRARINAFKNASVKNQNGNMIIVDEKYIKEYQLIETTDYQIAYQEPKNRYLLFIISRNFKLARKQAEEAFIKLIDLKKTELCQLNVDIVTPSWANQEYAGKEHRPSFCE